MKLYRESEAQSILDRGGILLETVDCDICGEIMVPHLLPEDATHPTPWGLCDAHYRSMIGAAPATNPAPPPRGPQLEAARRHTT